MIRHFFVVYNSLSRTAISYLDEIKAEFKHISAKYLILGTTAEENASDLVIANLTDDFTDILINGGDGTIFEVINALPDFKRSIGILPAGTGNDFYRMINSSNPMKSAIYGSHTEIDIGICNGFKFMNGIGCAIEGESANIFEQNRVGNRIKSNYFLSILGKVFTYQSTVYSITFDDDDRLDIPVFLLTIGNGRFFGSGYKLTPKAKLSDGLLDVVYVKNIPSIIALFIMAIVPFGWHIFVPFIHTKRVKRISIRSDLEFYFHADGEVMKSDKLMISLSDEKCKLRI